ncbi:hypothetical protein AMECASPLE_019890 [Ameca splendens]|uniref:PiggyBac transposable element-derived protein 4 C-terminal zinc-ribbon domain-containing protein n=1 Tax=Ameca splendens TaxID=208324 RepID=A0ABV1AC58_9TELE
MYLHVIHLCCGPTFTKVEFNQKKWRMFFVNLGSFLVKVHIEQRERVTQDPAAAAAEQTKQSVHTHRNTKSVSASILISQPCLNINHISHSQVRAPDSKRRRCQVCPSNKDRKTNTCFTCKRYLCKEHT